MRRRNPVWYTGRKDDLGLRIHPWTAFDGRVIDSPIWLTPDEGFARANAGYHGFVYTVEFEPRRTFPDQPLIDWVEDGRSRFLAATPFGRQVQKAIEAGEVFGEPVDDGWEILESIDRGDYSTMETKGLIDWVRARGYDSMVVTGDGPVNLAVFDPAPIRVVSIKPATPGHDPASCAGCKKAARRNPPDPREPPHGGTTKRVEKAAIYRHKPCEKRLGKKVVWRPTFVVDVEKWNAGVDKWGAQIRRRSERWWSVDPSTGREHSFDGPPQMPCPECGRLVSGEAIHGVKNDAVPCTAKCVAAIGPSCECTCAGANHGGAWGGAKANPTYYHGTRDEHMDSIMKKGLVYPFLSSEESQARCWGKNYSTKGGRDVRILEVEIDDEARVVPDFNLMDEDERKEALGIEPGEYFDVRSELLGGEDDLIEAGRRFGSNSVYDRECGGEASIYLGTVSPENLREVGREDEETRLEENPQPEDVYRERWERTGDPGHGLRYVAELEKGGFSRKLWRFHHAADVYERLAQIYEADGNKRMLKTVRQRLDEIAPELNAQFVRCLLCRTWFYVGSQATPRRCARTLSNHMAVCTERTPSERAFYKRERKWPQNRAFWRSDEGART